MILKRWAANLNRHFFQRGHADSQEACEKVLNITAHQGIKTRGSHFTPLRTGIIKRTQTTNAGEDAEQRGRSYTAGRNVNWCRHCGKQCGDFPTN